MITSVASFYLQGIEALPCEVEVAITPGQLTGTTIVGLPDASVRESIERVRAAIRSSNYCWPSGYLTINLAPASVRKEGPAFDLPIAIAVLMAGRTIDSDGIARGRRMGMAGELALDGGLRPIRGATSLAVLGRTQHPVGIVVPIDSAAEAAVVDGVRVFAATCLSDVVAWLNRQAEMTPFVATPDPEPPPILDFREVLAQEGVKRALTIAAAGWHNILMLGPPGTGKSMMSQCLPGILPPLTPEEAIEVLQIRSCTGGAMPGRFSEVCHYSTMPPFRSPHHSASAAAIIGGGTTPRPGEISMAHHGVLFLDELPEFGRLVLESLRQPLEEHAVTIARSSGVVRYPARCLVVAAMNPTRDGRRAGRRGADALAQLSAPLLDRIDLHVEVPQVPLGALRRATPGRSTRDLAAKVATARCRMRTRQGSRPNGVLTGPQLDEIGGFGDDALDALEHAITDLDLSARAWNRLRRMARTIADLDESDTVEVPHTLESVQYRTHLAGGPNGIR